MVGMRTILDVRERNTKMMHLELCREQVDRVTRLFAVLGLTAEEEATRWTELAKQWTVTKEDALTVLKRVVC